MSSEKKTPKIVGLLGKTRDELSATGSSAWISLFPGSKNAAGPGEDPKWVPDGSKPFRLLIVKNRVKTWLEPLDVKVLLNLIDDNKADIEAGFAIAGFQLEQQVEAQKKLLKE